MDEKVLVVDGVSDQLLAKARAEGVDTMWDRKDAMKAPCGFGAQGVCCRICAMGPCRVSPVPGKGAQKGICGATADVIVARNYARMVAAGSSAHSDHGREICHILHSVSRDGNYEIKDEAKLLSLAAEWGVETEGKDIYDVAHEVAEVALNEYGKPFGTGRLLERFPEPRKALWKREGLEVRAIDREIAGIMHSTHMGCAADAESIIRMAMRTSLGDMTGSMIGTELSDILFGTPIHRETESNIGVLDQKQVNIMLHGHEPTLSEMIVLAAEDAELVALAKEVGAEGINLVGVCCTANEVAMRHGVKLVGNFQQQELIIVTGAVEAAVVDVQCIFPSLVPLTEKYHTKFITTSPKAKITGATHIEFDEHKALDSAKEIVREAVLNFKNRDNSNVCIPQIRTNANVGYSIEAVLKQLDRVVNSHIDPAGTVKPLTDCLKAGVLRGAVAIVGCNNPKVQGDNTHLTVMKELIKNDIIVVTTGCAAQAAAKAGLLSKEARKLAGKGLATVCELVDIPPILHMGSCVDISRIMLLVSACAKALNIDIPMLPIAAVAPEWMSEKAVAIGTYAVTSGVETFLGVTPPVTGSPEVVDILTNRIADISGARFHINENPEALVADIIKLIEEKRIAFEGLFEQTEATVEA